MNLAPILDTHFWIWWIPGGSELKRSEIDYLDALPAEGRPFLCDVSLWEAVLLVEKGRVELDCTFEEFLEIATSPATVRILPISKEIVLAMNKLPASFHNDPADRLIVASARALDCPLATRDQRIRRSPPRPRLEAVRRSNARMADQTDGKGEAAPGQFANDFEAAEFFALRPLSGFMK